MATNHVPVPAAQAALSLLSLSSSTSPHAASPPPSVSTPALGRFVHAQRSTASVVKPSAAASGTSSGRRRLSGAVQTRRRMSDAASAAASPAVVLPLRNGCVLTRAWCCCDIGQLRPGIAQQRVHPLENLPLHLAFLHQCPPSPRHRPTAERRRRAPSSSVRLAQ
ncbi:hypothetical protein FRC08_007455, partial [Ceratobasidium sp. 394]